MEVVIKTFTAMFFLLFFLMLGTGLIAAQVHADNARDFRTDVVEEIENSDYAANVINQCIASADTADYDLEIILYDDEQKKFVFDKNTKANAEDTENAVTCEVRLGYDYSIPFLNSSTPHTLTGYTR